MKEDDAWEELCAQLDEARENAGEWKAKYEELAAAVGSGTVAEVERLRRIREKKRTS